MTKASLVGGMLSPHYGVELQVLISSFTILSVKLLQLVQCVKTL